MIRARGPPRSRCPTARCRSAVARLFQVIVPSAQLLEVEKISGSVPDPLVTHVRTLALTIFLVPVTVNLK